MSFNTFRFACFVLILILAPKFTLQAQEKRPSEIETMVNSLMTKFSEAFNSGNIDAQRETMHFPHFRLAGGKMTVIENLKDQPRIVPLESEWNHTKIDSLKIIDWSEHKVHVNVYFTRFRKDNSPISSFHALYIITKVDGRWAIKMRSSFAP